MFSIQNIGIENFSLPIPDLIAVFLSIRILYYRRGLSFDRYRQLSSISSRGERMKSQ